MEHLVPTMKLRPTGIELDDAGVIAWSEIVALHVSEVDTMTASVTILQLEHESGHFLEIHELDDAYPAALNDLALFLPLDQNWIRTTHGLEPRTSTTIWRR